MPTLLVADDSITVQRVIGLTFAPENIEVVAVSDGRAAIDRIKSAPPDIVLAGTTMPDINGYEVASFVRSQPSLTSVPVLLLTGAFETVDPAILKASGASGVLEKPLDPTIVIKRVKELLGIKRDEPAAPGRVGPPAQAAAATRPPAQREVPASSQARHREPSPVRNSKAGGWDELRESSGLLPDASPVEGGNGSASDDYLDGLDEALDSLDQHLAGRPDDRRADDKRHDRDGRNPSPPLAHEGTAANPRSPSRRPAAPATPEAAAASAIFEVDDAWFAEDKQAGEARATEEEELAAEEGKELAAEMGIRDVEAPAAPDAVKAAALAADLDFEFDADGEPKPIAAPTPPPEPVPATPPPPPDPMPAPATPASSRDVADDFAALLALEQGEHHHPSGPTPPAPAPAAVIVQAAPPEITDAMLDQIAQRVADRLNAGLFADQLRHAMTATVRDTVREVVSETSERLVRDEIARVKAQAERETH